MSESSFPFGAPSSPPPSPFGAPPQQTPAGRQIADDASDGDGPDKRQRYLLGGLAALVVAGLGAGAYLLLGGGDDSSAASATALPKPKTQVTVGTGLPTVQATLPQTYDGLKGQDPFRPLVVVPVAAPSAPAAGPAPATQPTGGATQVPTYPLPGFTFPAPVPTGGSTLPPGADKPSSIHLDSVSDGNDKAVFEVGGAKSEVGIGDTFATYFKLLRLEAGRCGTVQFGDERFDICQGEDVKL